MYHYNAFISYNHNPRDMKIAQLLQHKLESYKVPKEVLASGGNKLERVFLDKGELEVSGDLNDVIQGALENSDYLIVICSPESKESIWVRREMEFFLKNHTIDQILTVITDGEPFDVLPDLILYRDEFNEETGETERIFREPLSCDYRMPAAKANRQELPRLVAALLGCKYDDLIQRQKAYRMRRQIALLVSAAVVLTTAVSYLVWSNHRIKINYDNTLREQSINLAVQSARALKQGDRLGAVRYALDGLPKKDSPRPVVSEAVLALADALDLYQTDKNDHWNSLKQYAYDTGFTMSIPFSTGKRNYLAARCPDGRVMIWDTDTYEEIMPDYTQSLFDSGTEIRSFFVSDDKELIMLSMDRIIALDISGSKERYNVAVTSPEGKEGHAIYSFNEDDLAHKGDRLWIEADFEFDPCLISIDLKTGKALDKIAIDDVNWTDAVRLSDDGKSLAVLTTSYPENDQSHSTIKVYDSSSGKVIQTFERGYASDIAFASNDRLLICGLSGSHDIKDDSVSSGVHYSTGVLNYSWTESKRRTQEISCCELPSGSTLWSIENEKVYHSSPQLDFTGKNSFYPDHVICTTGNDVIIFDKNGNVADHIEFSSDVKCFGRQDGGISAILSDGSLAIYEQKEGSLVSISDTYMSPVVSASFDEDGDGGRIFIGTHYDESWTRSSCILQYEYSGADKKWKKYKDPDYSDYQNYGTTIVESAGDCFIEILPADYYDKDSKSLAHIFKRKISDGTVVLDKEIPLNNKPKYSSFDYAGTDSEKSHAYFVCCDTSDASAFRVISVDLENGETEDKTLKFTSPADIESENTSILFSFDNKYSGTHCIHDGTLYMTAFRSTTEYKEDLTYTSKEEFVVIEADLTSLEAVSHVICGFDESPNYGQDCLVDIDPASGKILFADKEAGTVKCYNMKGKELSATQPLDYFPAGLELTEDGHILALDDGDVSNVVLHVLDQKSGSETASVPLGNLYVGGYDFGLITQTSDEDTSLLVIGSSALVFSKSDWSLRAVINNYCAYSPESATLILGDTSSLFGRSFGCAPYRTLEEMISEGNELLGQ